MKIETLTTQEFRAPELFRPHTKMREFLMRPLTHLETNNVPVESVLHAPTDSVRVEDCY